MQWGPCFLYFSFKSHGLQMMRDELIDGGKVYLVYPIIDESEHLPQLRAATAEFDSIKQKFKGYPCGLLHGRMRRSGSHRCSCWLCSPGSESRRHRLRHDALAATTRRRPNATGIWNTSRENWNLFLSEIDVRFEERNGGWSFIIGGDERCGLDGAGLWAFIGRVRVERWGGF